MRSLTHGISVGTVAIDAIPESLWPRLAGLLDRAERQRITSFVFERDRRRQIAAHALRRLMLTACAPKSVPPKTWRFEVDAAGKARVLDRAGPNFNVSHCDGLLACGVSRRFRLGVDVKPLTDNVSFEFARSQFTEGELFWLSQQPAEVYPQAFFRLWNLKEAYRNTANLDPTVDVPDFVRGCDPLRSRSLDPASADAAAWRFFQVEIGQRHTLALAWQAGPRKIPIDIRAVHIEEMLYGVPHEGRSSPWRFGSKSGIVPSKTQDDAV